MFRSFATPGILRVAVIATLLTTTLSHVQGQDINLANQYFSNGEYEKAASIYSQISAKEPHNDFVFKRYFDCLLNLERFEEAEKATRQQIKRSPENSAYYVMLGDMYERTDRKNEANKQYQMAVDKIQPDFGAVTRVANTFISSAKYDYALAAFERGNTLLRDPNRFAYNMADVYRRKGDTPKMIEYYLNALIAEPGRQATIQMLFERYVAPADFDELQKQIYARLQKDDNPEYIEILAWTFVQKKDFKSAFRQYRALDKRLNENGQRVYKLAVSAAENKDYDAAISAYEYILNEKGRLNPFFFDSKREVMACRRKKVTESYDYSRKDLEVLINDYEQFLNEYGRGKQTSGILLEYAKLMALYVNDLKKAIALLDELIKTPGLDRNTAARVKINLADYYLMDGDVWESTLLYSQVDKAFAEEQLGQEARFKNARLAYFNGDFEWAQAQFDILKAATSRLIANDAIDMSVFIMDNLDMDTTSEAISLYAAAEMLTYQNRFAEAFLKLDTLRRTFPDHSLQDDILYLEAQIFEKKRDWEKAASRYEEIVEKFGQDIRADNALYNLAQIHEFHLGNIEKAMELYEKLFIDYSGSILAVDARKRYRILRGDKVQ